MIALLQVSNLALRFLLELCVLTALGYWGFQMGNGLLVKAALTIGAPLAAAWLWATFGAPGAAHELTGFLHLLLEVGVFGLAVVALMFVGRPTLAWVLGLALVSNGLLMRLWGQ